MAFFKFRFPGQEASSSASPETMGAGTGESIEVLRRRARHRLMGAVVLVVTAVVGFPLLFDTDPRPVAADMPVMIQDQYRSGPLGGASQTAVSPVSPVSPVLPESPTSPVQAEVRPVEGQISVPSTADLKPLAAVEPVDKPPEAAVQRKSQPIAAKTDVKAAAAPVAKPQAKDDGSKARALLEGRSQMVSKAPSGERHVVQVGAFTDPAKVREVRRKLEQAGVSTFIQVIDGPSGQATTRIRVGPFSTRAEADQAAARIRQLNFAPAVLRL